MRLRIFIEPQMGATYETQLAVAKATEDLGFDAFIRSDHYIAMLGAAGDPGPTDSWVTLGALARETSRIRLGTLMTAATFRMPGPLAISVAQVDQMSGGRVDFGLGTGWHEQEHTAYGIPFPSLGERFARLEEQLQIVTGLWRTPEGERFSFAGEHYTLADSPALPKPAQPGGPPVIIGGFGAKRTPRLAAQYADEYNAPFQTLPVTAGAFDRVRTLCWERERTKPLVYSVAQSVCCGRNKAEIRRRADVIGQDVADLREAGLAGTPAEIVEKVGAFGELGAECVYLQVLDMHDLEHIALLASDVLAQL